MKKSISEKQKEYTEKYKQIIVKYGDGSKKKFTPEKYAIFEDGISKMRNVEIKFVER